MLSRPSLLRLILCLILFHPAIAHADRLDTAFEKAIGNYFAREFAAPFGTETDPILAGYVGRLGADVARESHRDDITCRFVIVGSDTANAYALPGGYIMVTRGLLDSIDSDDELASILAHETGHVAKRHATQQIGFNLGFTILRRVLPQKTLGRNGDTLLAVYSILRSLNKSKEQEAQADEEGIDFAYAAGYDPGGLVQFFDGIGGYSNRIEEYFATHPSPEKRIASARKNPLVTRAGSAEREFTADGYKRRGLPGLAETVRRGEDPFAFPPLPPSPLLPNFYLAQQKTLEDVAKGERAALTKFYKVNRAATIAQQLLLLNTQLGDPRWIYLSGRAYAVQGRISDIYSRSARILRTAPGHWDALARQNLVNPAGSEGAINGALGRGEIGQSLDLLRGVATPLSRAQSTTAAVLFDLNNRFFRADNATTWVRYAALEGALRYAESELDRADERSGKAWRVLSVARIRRYENRLNEMVSEDDPAKRAVWNDLLRRRIGAAFPTQGSTGMATTRAIVAVSLGASAMETYGNRGTNDFVADWVLKTEGISPENVATVLRLATLEMEREIAARERHGVGTPLPVQEAIAPIRTEAT
ncbi:MAG: M48 family metalloprotease [Akkermansiaceae bacterium]|nr:M48 family metalloprotease [Armatimonadota bacterium]